MNENYCMINEQTNICENICLWDGNKKTWNPPDNYLMLIQANTPSKIWKLKNNTYELVEEIGQGQINFIWDGTFLITNQPQPESPLQNL